MLSQSVLVDVLVVESKPPCPPLSSNFGVFGAFSNPLVAPAYERVTEVPADSVRADGDVPSASLHADRRVDVFGTVYHGAFLWLFG